MNRTFSVCLALCTMFAIGCAQASPDPGPDYCEYYQEALATVDLPGVYAFSVTMNGMHDLPAISVTWNKKVAVRAPLPTNKLPGVPTKLCFTLVSTDDGSLPFVLSVAVGALASRAATPQGLPFDYVGGTSCLGLEGLRAEIFRACYKDGVPYVFPR